MTASELPIRTLKAEHQIILRVIHVLDLLMNRLEQTGEFSGPPLARCVEFLRLFADACHHAKEEDLLFPVLESCGIPREGGPIGVMLYEHQVARRLTREMSDSIAEAQATDGNARTQFHQAARQYIDLLSNHIFKEDNILFNMGNRVMSVDDQDKLKTEFCAVNCRVFEGRRREELQAIADELEAQVGT